MSEEIVLALKTPATTCPVRRHLGGPSCLRMTVGGNATSGPCAGCLATRFLPLRPPRLSWSSAFNSFGRGSAALDHSLALLRLWEFLSNKVW